MLDVARRAWSHEMVDAADIDARLLPAVFESPEICARVSRAASAVTGISPHTDRGRRRRSAAGAIAWASRGLRVSRPSALRVVFAATTVPRPPQGGLHTFCHAILDAARDGVTQAAGLSLRCFAISCLPARRWHSYDN